MQTLFASDAFELVLTSVGEGEPETRNEGGIVALTFEPRVDSIS